MIKTFSTVASLAALVQTALAQQALFINTPAALVQCQPALLNFGGGSGAPYFIAALPAGQVSATPILQLPEQSSTSYSWIVNLPAGANLTLSVRDSQGSVQYSSPVAIQAGISDACLDEAGSASATAAGAVSSGVASSASASATASPAVSIATSAADEDESTLVSSAASATVTASAGSPSSVPSNGTEPVNTYNFTCGPDEGDLTYGITVVTLDGIDLEQATSYFSEWTAAAPGPLTNSSGEGVGATRTYTVGGNVTFDETLILDETNSTTDSLHQQWNFTTEADAVLLGDDLVLYNAFSDLTIYTNDTTNETSMQYFILACFSDQASGLTALASQIQSTVAYYAGQLNGTNDTSAEAAFSAPARRLVKLF